MECSAGPDTLILAFFQQEMQLGRNHNFQIQFMFLKASTTSLGYAFQAALRHGANLRDGREGRSCSLLYLATGFPQPNLLTGLRGGRFCSS